MSAFASFDIQRTDRESFQVLPASDSMNSNLQRRLRLQELNLLHQELTLAGANREATGFDFMEERIKRVRWQVPGPVLSLYDAVSRRRQKTALTPNPDTRAATFAL